MTPYCEHDGITIYHGDCLEVLPTLPTVNLVLSDPPFGIALKEHGRNGHNWSIKGDATQEIGISVLDYCDFQGWPQVIFASPKKPWPGKWRQRLVWDKGPAVGGGGDIKTCWKFDWELIMVRRTGRLNGQRDSSVLRHHIGQPDYKYHPCQKPLGLLQYLIGKTTCESDVVIDPFVGSGSTLVAAKNMGRKAIGIEIEEKYCEIAANRLRQRVLF